MFNIISYYFKKILNDRKQIKMLLKDNKEYFINGKYIITGMGKKAAYVKNNITLEFVKSNLYALSNTKKNYLKLFIKKVLNKTIKVNNNGVTLKHHGSLLMYTRNKDIKVFDFINNKVITVFHDKHKYYRMKHNYNLFSCYFKIPYYEFIDNRTILVENYIKSKTYNDWSELEKKNAFNFLFRIYELYFTDCNKKDISKIHVNDMYIEFKNEIKHNELVYIVSEILEKYEYDNSRITNWPLIYLHGDFAKNNILIEKNNYYIIDWEESDFRIFIFDIMNYFYTTGNLKLYFSGEYDKEFENIFALFGLKYNINHRMFYFIIFVLERTIWESKITVNTNDIFNRLCIIINNYK